MDDGRHRILSAKQREFFPVDQAKTVAKRRKICADGRYGCWASLLIPPVSPIPIWPPRLLDKAKELGITMKVFVTAPVA
ncbi:MAG: hypothetical protein ACLRXC_11095 [[Clostridium] leptum]